MSFLSRRILNQHELATGATQDLSETLDLAAYQTLDLVVMVLEAATGDPGSALRRSPAICAGRRQVPLRLRP